MSIYKWPADKENDTGIVSSTAPHDGRKSPWSAGRLTYMPALTVAWEPSLVSASADSSQQTPLSLAVGGHSGQGSCRSAPRGRLHPWASEGLWTVSFVKS